MGLDISAYRQIKLMPEGDPEVDHYLGATPSEFLSRADGIESGCYEATESFGFAAGSYSFYGEWRERLAQLAGYPAVLHQSSWERAPRARHAAGAWEADSGPFWELIHFSDCEGVIGPKTAAKLATDFADHQHKVDALNNEPWFRERYAQFRKAFDMASDGGAVHFH